MSMRILVAAPSHPKLFMDLAVAARIAIRAHAGLQIDILTAAPVPSWWVAPAGVRVLREPPPADATYDLLIQTDPDPVIGARMAAVKAKHRGGVVGEGGTAVQGRWAQTLMAQMGARRFGPFTPHDLHVHVLLGHAVPVAPRTPGNLPGVAVVDLDSFPAERRDWAEELLQAASAGSVRVLDRIPAAPTAVSTYWGCDPVAAAWWASEGAHVVLCYSGPFDTLNAAGVDHAVYQPFSADPAVRHVLALPRQEACTGGAFRLTSEYLGGLFRSPGTASVQSSEEVFDQLHYVVLNYLNDLREVDLPIPRVDAAGCLRLKGVQAVFAKLVHLNLFAVKFLQEFLTKVADGTVIDADIHDVGAKIGEIDQLTEQTLAAHPEMDVYRLILKFAKSAAPGENMVEVAKSLILVFHESNQALEAYAELIGAVVKEHVRPAPGAVNE